jgi:hypothetical protein
VFSLRGNQNCFGNLIRRSAIRYVQFEKSIGSQMFSAIESSFYLLGG